MLDALLGDERKDPDQYDENYGVACLDCFHRRSRVREMSSWISHYLLRSGELSGGDE